MVLYKSTPPTDLVVINDDRKAITTSLIVAEKFGKRHDHVKRDIEKIIKSIEKQDSPDIPGSQEISLPTFGESEYTNGRGKVYAMYEMDQNAFMLVVMGFNGAKALKFKLAFIAAFNVMEKKLMEMTKGPPFKNHPLRGLAVAIDT